MKLSHVSLPVQAELRKHCVRWGGCKTCKIGAIAARHVFWRGSALPCSVLFVGEAPGKAEDVIGEPFVGSAGRVLDALIAAAELRCSWAVTNAVACRPTDCAGGPNREPTEQEVSNCSDRLLEFIRMAQPKRIVALGAIARAHLPAVAATISPEMRVLELYHPAYLLRVGGQYAYQFRQQADLLRDFTKELPCL